MGSAHDMGEHAFGEPFEQRTIRKVQADQRRYRRQRGPG
jgi:hypothetical protein